MTVGVLALQGCVDQHIEHLKQCSVNSRRVRSPEDLEGLDRIILPGGESSTMLLLLKRSGLWESLKNFVKLKPAWGVCAGAILLAQEVEHPSQESLAALPIRAYRNFYGSQLDSFSAMVKIKPLKKELAVDFIRAPKLENIGAECEVLATYNNLPVLMKKNRAMVSSFHSELGADSSLHKYFISL
jgi:5'-phosphate synthase pdxT subunit